MEKENDKQKTPTSQLHVNKLISHFTSAHFLHEYGV